MGGPRGGNEGSGTGSNLNAAGSVHFRMHPGSSPWPVPVGVTKVVAGPLPSTVHPAPPYRISLLPFHRLAPPTVRLPRISLLPAPPYRISLLPSACLVSPPVPSASHHLSSPRFAPPPVPSASHLTLPPPPRTSPPMGHWPPSPACRTMWCFSPVPAV